MADFIEDVKESIKQRPVWGFFLLVFGITTTIWGIAGPASNYLDEHVTNKHLFVFVYGLSGIATMYTYLYILIVRSFRIDIFSRHDWKDFPCDGCIRHTVTVVNSPRKKPYLNFEGNFHSISEFELPSSIEKGQTLQIKYRDYKEVGLYLKYKLITEDGDLIEKYLRFSRNITKQTGEEWNYRIRPQRTFDDWRFVRINVRKALRKTYGTDSSHNFKFDSVTIFRIRGHVNLQSIEIKSNQWTWYIILALSFFLLMLLQMRLGIVEALLNWPLK